MLIKQIQCKQLGEKTMTYKEVQNQAFETINLARLLIDTNQAKADPQILALIRATIAILVSKEK
jgi:hypothetical protein